MKKTAPEHVSPGQLFFSFSVVCRREFVPARMLWAVQGCRVNAEGVVLSEDVEKIPIGGIKFSEELVQVSLVKSGDGESSFGYLLDLLAGKKINISFLCHSARRPQPKSSFCISCADFVSVREMLDFPSFAHFHKEIILSVGTLTLFPHRYSLGLLGSILNIFGKFNFPIYSLSTSISAIAVNTAYQDLASITDKLEDVVSLPENHAPFRKEFRLKEI